MLPTPVDRAPLVLALRLAGLVHAIGRDRGCMPGSDAACDLRLPGGAAPRRASVGVTANRATVHDLGGGQDTTHDGAQVTTAGIALPPGDVVAFGNGIAEAHRGWHSSRRC